MNPIKLIVKYLITIDKRPLILGIDGGSSSGKTYFTKSILKELKLLRISFVHIKMDDYFYDRSERIYPKKRYFNMKNWYKFNLIANHLRKIKKGKCSLLLPTYSHKTGKIGKTKKINFTGKQLVFLDGIFSFDNRIRKYLNLKILIETNPKLRLKRELQRNVSQRHQSKDFVIKRFNESIQPTYKKHYKEIKKYADFVVNNDDWRYPRILFISKKLKNSLI